MPVSPRRAGSGSVETRSPIRCGSGWAWRMPSASATTTKDMPDASRITSASGWIRSAGSGSSNDSRIEGSAAVASAMASARRPYCSCSDASLRRWNARAATNSVPTTIASCSSSVCADRDSGRCMVGLQARCTRAYDEAWPFGRAVTTTTTASVVTAVITTTSSFPLPAGRWRLPSTSEGGRSWTGHGGSPRATSGSWRRPTPAAGGTAPSAWRSSSATAAETRCSGW